MAVKNVKSLLLMAAIAIGGCLGDDYLAAVVDYSPTHNRNLSDQENIMNNVRKYEELLESVHQQLDIIVFPELTLSHGCSVSREGFLSYATTIPNPDDHLEAPCDSSNYEPYLKQLSCVARNKRTYLSANMVEKFVCDSRLNPMCAPDGHDIYNTNVVFDRDGKVVSRYRKFNLFDEFAKNVTAEPEAVPFTTDFGVTFGVFVCFDIMFDKPIRKLLDNGVEHFIYPTFWFSELPLLSSIQTQQMWAYENDVVLLAAGANIPFTASGGSGIYHGRQGPLAAHFVNHEGSTVLVHRVQKSLNTCDASPPSPLDNNDVGASMDDYPFLVADMTGATLLPLDLNKPQQRVCTDSNFCCDFQVIGITNAVSHNYHLVAYNRVKYLGLQRKAGLQFCAVLNCKGDKCGVRIPNTRDAYSITFEKIIVSGNFSTNRTAQYPNSLTADYMPIPIEQFRWESKRVTPSMVWRSQTLLESRDDIYAFAIFSREYNKDN